MIDTYDIKYCLIEGTPKEIVMKSCLRCTGKQFRNCEYKNYSFCKRHKNLKKED